ncbi:MAG: hypothetical protein AAGH65_12490, partial [Pseudomonadota bacterium]
MTTSFPISGDGSEAAGDFVADFCKRLSDYMPVRVVAPGLSSCQESWGDSVDVFRFRTPPMALSNLKLWRPDHQIQTLRILSAGMHAVRAAVAAGPTAHVFALWALPSGHWARSVAQSSGLPYSIWTLGSDIWSLATIPIVKQHLSRILREANRCFSDGLKLAKETKRVSGRQAEFLPSTRMIQQRRTHPLAQQPPYRYTFLGRWHKNKGIDLLIDALKLLNDDDWSCIDTIDIYG